VSVQGNKPTVSTITGELKPDQDSQQSDRTRGQFSKTENHDERKQAAITEGEKNYIVCQALMTHLLVQS